MRQAAMIRGILGLSSLFLLALCSCSLASKYFPPDDPTLPDSVAVDRALKLCSLTEGEQPFHLILSISPPIHPSPSSIYMHAQVEIFWLNAVTYRTVVRSRDFSQTRTVNGPVIEEHNIGTFYPRWIENFVDALLEPLPHADSLKKLPGSIPVGRLAHACISVTGRPGTPSDSLALARACFQDTDPKIASGIDFSRYVSFDDFEPFGSQQIPRTLVNNLPPNTLVRGKILLLEPLPQSAHSLLRAHEFTSPARQIRTARIPEIKPVEMTGSSADFSPEVYSVSAPGKFSLARSTKRRTRRERSSGLTSAVFGSSKLNPSGENQTIRDSERPGRNANTAIIYVRTDRSGRVREAYPDSLDLDGREAGSVAYALTLKLKPLIVNGAAQQIETTIAIPLNAARSR